MSSRIPPGVHRRRSRESTFPLVPIVIATVVVGLALGVAIAAFRHNGASASGAGTPAPVATSSTHPAYARATGP